MPHHRPGIAFLAVAIASSGCSQVQDFRRDVLGADVVDARAEDVPIETSESDAAGDSSSSFCATNGFVRGPVEVSTGSDNVSAVVARSGADLVVVWISGFETPPAAIHARFLDAVTLAPRADAVTVHAETGDASLRDLAVVPTVDGAAIAFSRTGLPQSESHFALVGRDGSVVERGISLGTEQTIDDRVSAIAATGRGFGVTVRSRIALWLVRLGPDGLPADASALTFIASHGADDVATSTIGWDPAGSRFVIVYPRLDSRALMSARVSESGTLEASDLTVFDHGVSPTHFPDIVWNGVGFGVLTCFERTTGGCEPVVEKLDPDLIPMGTPVHSTGTVDAFVRDSAIALGGETYGVIWSGLLDHARVATIDRTGTVRTDANPLPIGADVVNSPDVVWNDDGFAGVWETISSPISSHRIYAARLCAP